MSFSLHAPPHTQQRGAGREKGEAMIQFEYVTLTWELLKAMVKMLVRVQAWHTFQRKNRLKHRKNRQSRNAQHLRNSRMHQKLVCPQLQRPS